MKIRILLIIIISAIALIGVVIGSMSASKNTNYLQYDDDDFLLAFIIYDNSTLNTSRYLIYPDNRVEFSHGLHKGKIIDRVSDPDCFEEITHSSTGSLSGITFNRIIRLANNINSDFDNRNGQIAFGGHGIFIAYNGQYYDVDVDDLSSADYYIVNKLINKLEGIKLNRCDAHNWLMGNY